MSEKVKHIYRVKTIHGPNLNLLGTRETQIYGSETLTTINQKLTVLAQKENVFIDFFQSNHEGELIDVLQNAHDYHGFLFNPAAYTHTSIALRDTLLAMNKPFVEIHLSDINQREDFRKKSYFSDIALAIEVGKGAQSYYDGFTRLINHLKGDK